MDMETLALPCVCDFVQYNSTIKYEVQFCIAIPDLIIEYSDCLHHHSTLLIIRLLRFYPL
jgi:hypothetical protein